MTQLTDAEKQAATHPGALHGLRVLDLSRVLAGPLAAQVLADLGADVIKIERPRRGDDSREWAPPFVVDTPESPLDASVYFWACNRGKRSLTVNIASPQGQALVERLATQSDIFIENYKAGTLQKYGLGYEALARHNPRLIYCSITGFGQTGPYSSRPGYDTIIQALGGLMSVTGHPDPLPGAGPLKSGLPMVDMMTALYAVVAILAAVNERHSSGKGQYIDMSLLDVQVAALSNIGLNYLVTGVAPKRAGNRLTTVCPSDVFRCLDGECMLIVGNDEQFRRFCEVMELHGVAEDPRFSRNEARLTNVDALDPIISKAMAQRTMQQCQSLLDAAGVPGSPINNFSQVFADPQVVARNMVRELGESGGRRIPMIASPIRMSRTPPVYPRPPPLLGEHNKEILGAVLGLSGQQCADLARVGAI